MSETDAHFRDVLAAGERVLSRHFAAPLKLAEPVRLGGTKGRSRVLRCTVEGAGPATVILKQTVGDEPADLAEDLGDAQGSLGRLAAEWAGGELLAQQPFARRSYGSEPQARLILLEDLGPGSCLADHLEGDDRARLETGLLHYAAGMGRLHAATIGREAAYMQLRASLGVTSLPEPSVDREPGGWMRVKARPLLAQLEALGVALPVGVARELEEVAVAFEEPGPFLAFTPGDTCPDNHHVGADGTLRFFDFEFSGFRHALLDAAYARVPFPTCWCVNGLPEAPVVAAEEAYRTALVVGCPEASDDALFYRALTQACALWSLTSLTVGKHKKLDLAGALEVEEKWGIATSRQRHLLRLETLATATQRHGQLPAVGELASRTSAKLRALWPDTVVPLYPAYRG